MFKAQDSVARIKALAKKEGIPVSKMLADCGFNRNLISDAKSRNAYPTADKIAKIADYFSVSTDYLLGRTDTKSPMEIPDKKNELSNYSMINRGDILMTTRLRSEAELQKVFPELKWLLVCTTGEYEITIYACDADMNLSECIKDKIFVYTEERGMLSCRYKIKHYFERRNDNVFIFDEPPENIKHLALTSGVTSEGIRHCLKEAFPSLDPDSLTSEKNVVYVSPKKGSVLTQAQVAMTELLLAEIVPIGSIAKIRHEAYVPDFVQAENEQGQIPEFTTGAEYRIRELESALNKEMEKNHQLRVELELLQANERTDIGSNAESRQSGNAMA